MKLLKIKNLNPIFAIALVAILSYGLSLFMFFNLDDYAVLFKLQHPQEPAGNFGQGIIGTGPYKYAISFFYPFFKLFGLNPFGYFLLGLIVFILACIVFFHLSSSLLNNKKIALFSSLIFASGFIGSESFLRIATNVQTGLGLIFCFLCFLFLVRYLNKNTILNYILSLIFYFFSIEFVNIRSHSLITQVLAFVLIFSYSKNVFRYFIKNILIFIPYLILFSAIYHPLETNSTGGNVLRAFSDITKGNFEIFPSLLATLGNVFIPEIIINKIVLIFKNNSMAFFTIIFLLFSYFLLKLIKPKIKRIYAIFPSVLISYFFIQFLISKNYPWFLDPITHFSAFVGLFFCLFFTQLALHFRHSNQSYFKTIIFSVFFMISQIIVYCLIYKSTIYGTTQRYLSYCPMGISLIYGIIAFELSKSIKGKLRYLPIIFIVLGFLILNIKQELKIIKTISIPSRNFYKSFTKLLPKINKGDTIYIDSSNTTSRLLGSFFSVGSMPDSTALAVFYNIDRYDFNLDFDYNQMYFDIKDKDKIPSVHYFYYNGDLYNLSEEFRKLLMSGSPWKSIKETTPLSFFDINLSANNIVNEDLSYPYSFTNLKEPDWEFENKLRAIDYYLAKKEYYRNVKIKSVSSWKNRNIEFSYDDNPDTSWWGHRLTWHYEKNEEIIIDIGSIKNISRLFWTNTHFSLTPTDYEIFISKDNINWNKIIKISGGGQKGNGEKVEEKIGPSNLRYIKIKYYNTFNGDSPSVAEFEVVESRFDNLDIKKADNFFENPFSYVGSKDEINTLLTKAGPLIKIRVEVKTNKGNFAKDIPLNKLNNLNSYFLTFAPQGSHFVDIEVKPINAPIELSNINTKLRNLSFEETQKRNLIKDQSAIY